MVQDFATAIHSRPSGDWYLGDFQTGLRGSDWWLADRPLDTGLPMGRYCDLASFDGRRCVVRGTLFDTEEMVPNSEVSIFVEVSYLEFRSRELFVNARITTAHLARCQFMLTSSPILTWDDEL